jgi:hypothetical protein
MGIKFWDAEVSILDAFLPQGENINVPGYRAII